MSLADYLSDEDRAARFEEQFKPGLVLYLRCPFLDLHYDKYLLLVCVEPCPILLFINAEILAMYERRPAHKARQLPLLLSEADFLTQDSFIDCTTPILNFSKGEIKERVMRDMARMRGNVSNTVLLEVLRNVSAANMMEYRKKQWIVNSLRVALSLG